MGRKALGLLTAVLVICTGGLAFFLSDRSTPLSRAEPVEEAGPNPREDASVLSPGSDADSEGVDAVVPSSPHVREAAERGAAVWGWVVDEEGTPVPEADVVLAALSLRDLAWEPAWREGEWGALELPRSHGTTDGQGSFRFETWIGPEEGGDFVLSAARAGFETVFVHGTYPPSGSGALRLVLRQAPPINVLVLDERGLPVVGATVGQFGLADKEATRTRDTAEGIWRRYGGQTAVTGSDGRTRIPRLPGQQVLVAELEGNRSLPWRGVPGAGVTLRLLPGFELGGVLTLPDWSSLNYEGERRIRVTAKTGGVERSLVTLRDVRAGTWGPVTLPVLSDASYTVHLEGSPIIPVRQTFEAPQPGSTVAVDLDAQLGTPLWVLVTDTEGEAISDSEVTLAWNLDGIPNHVTRRAQDDGFVNMWSIPPVEFRIVAKAPGYATQELPGQELPENDEYLTIALVPAGKVEGHCSYRNEPVSDFTVVAYQQLGRRWSETQFHSRDDGSFVIDDVPLGDVYLVASSASLPPSEPRSVHVSEGDVARVDLELQEGWRRRGQVVDGERGDPVPAAVIRRRVVENAVSEHWWGPDTITGQDGGFELNAMPRGNSFLQVSAAGFSSMRFRVSAGPDTPDTPLRLELERPVPLRIRLVGLGPGSYGVFTANDVAHPESLPKKPFDADGFVEYDAVNPGVYRVDIRGGGGIRDDVKVAVDVRLRPRTPLSVEVRVGGPNRVAVDLDPETVEGPLDEYWVVLVYRTTAGLDASLVGLFSKEGRFEIDGIDARTVRVEAVRRSGELVAAGQGTFVDGQLALHLKGGETPFELRVVDPSGNPLADVSVIAVDPRTSALGASARTNGGGIVHLLGLPPRKVLLNIYSGIYGDKVGVPIDGSRHAETVVLENDFALLLRTMHRGSPVTGAAGEFRIAQTLAYFSNRTSDSGGLLSWQSLSPGTYRVRITHPAFWPVELDLPAAKDPKEVPVELRKLGTLTLRLVTLEGARLPGQALHLTDLATDEDVDSWLATGRVTSSSAVTDSVGELTLEGIPEGSYRVTGANGADLGTATVTGDGSDLEVLRLDAR